MAAAFPTRRIAAAWCIAVCVAAVVQARGADAPHPALGALERTGRWKAMEPPKIFGPENLYEEIDGEAEAFLPYGMRRLTVGIVSSLSAEGGEVRVELYRMASARDAFGVYSQHRYPDQDVVLMPPSEVILSESSADFFRGDTFVRLRARPGEVSRRLVAALSKELVAVLPGSGEAPAEAAALERFPGRTRGSIIYQKVAMLGYECLAPGFEARFAVALSSGRVVLLPPEPGSAAARMERIARELPGFDKVSAALFRAELPSGTLWMASVGHCVAGVAGVPSREEAQRLLAILSGEAGGICGSAPHLSGERPGAELKARRPTGSAWSPRDSRPPGHRTSSCSSRRPGGTFILETRLRGHRGPSSRAVDRPLR